MGGVDKPSLIISKLKGLCQKIKLFDRAEIKDSRKRPQIPTVNIFKSLLLIPIVRIKSLLQLDSSLRLPEYKGFIGTRRKMVVSDSTIERSLSGFTIGPLRVILSAIFGFCKRAGYMKIKLSTGRKVAAGVIDGSTMGKKLASVFYAMGKVNLMIDVKKIKKRGKELEASWELLESNLSKVEVVVVDGLYYVKKKINEIRSQGKHILIKTKEKNLDVIEDAEGIFKHYENFPDVEYYEGTQVREDGEKFSYKVWALAGFMTDGVDYPLKVAKVEMVNIITEEKEIFYAITTWCELTGLEMKELSHLRWRVENNGFKKGNEQFALKHAFINNEHGWEALTLILFIGFNLFEILKTQLIDEAIIEATRKTTYILISKLIERAITIVYGTGVYDTGREIWMDSS